MVLVNKMCHECLPNILSFNSYEEVPGIVTPGVKCARWLATLKGASVIAQVSD